MPDDEQRRSARGRRRATTIARLRVGTLVVGLDRSSPPSRRLPAAVDSNAPSTAIRMMIGFGKTKTSTTIPKSPTNHIHGDSAAIARPPSSGDDRQQVEQVQEEAGEGERRQNSRCRVASAIGMHAAAPSEPRIGPARPTRASASGVVAQRLGPHRAPRNGMNTGALASMPSRRSWIDVAHLVDEQQHHEPEGELPSPDQAVGADRDEHRRRRREELELGQQQQRRPCRTSKIASSADHEQRAPKRR